MNRSLSLLVGFLAASAIYLYSFPQANVLYAGVVLLHCLFAETEARREQSAVLISVALDAAEAHNRALTERYPHLDPG